MACPNITTGIDDKNVTDIYINGILPIETTGNRIKEGITKGQLTSATLDDIIKNFKHTGIIPVLTKTNTDAYLTKQSKLIEDIKSEYCWYYNRYLYSVGKLMNEIASNIKTNSPVSYIDLPIINKGMGAGGGSSSGDSGNE